MGKRRLRFKITNVISRVLLLNLRRTHRVKPVAPSAAAPPPPALDTAPLNPEEEEEEEEERSLIVPSLEVNATTTTKKKKAQGAFRYGCCSREDTTVRDNCHKSVKSSSSRKNKAAAPSPAAPLPSPLPHRREDHPAVWKREGLWNVVAATENGKVVKKKVVLKKRSSSSSPVMLLDYHAMGGSMLHSARFPDHPSLDKRSGNNATAAASFRLSTSSGDASSGHPEGLAWDKELSLFASDDSGSGLGSSKLVHRATTLGDEHGTIEEESRLKNGAGQVSRDKKSSAGPGTSTSSSSSSSNSSHRHYRRHHRHLSGNSFHLSRNHGSGNNVSGDEPDEVLGLLLSSSGMSPPRISSSSNSGRGGISTSSLESTSKLWEDQQARLFASSSSDNPLKHKVTAQTTAIPAIPSSRRDTTDRHGKRRPSSRGSRGDLPAAVRGKAWESVPVMLVSNNPYEDFRQSMVQMIFEKKLNKAADLEELLECYLYLNPPGFHEVIVQVFTDLWLQALSSEKQQRQRQSL